MEHKLIHRGSTKDIYELDQDYYIFKFSDRYSIFDYGEMPDIIPGKGQSMCDFTYRFYRHLNEHGINSHLAGRGKNADELIVKKVTRTGFSSNFKSRVEFIPLEVIFRLGVGEGSSLLLEGIELGTRFLSPRIEFTTKLERVDRKLNIDEAQEISSLNHYEFESLLSVSSKIAKILNDYVSLSGFILWDGKIEFAIDRKSGEIILVDSLSIDEMRITFNGVSLSKEILRKYYRDTEWHKTLVREKKNNPDEFYKNIEAPSFLPVEKISKVSKTYQMVHQILGNKMNERELSELNVLLKEL